MLKLVNQKCSRWGLKILEWAKGLHFTSKCILGLAFLYGLHAWCKNHGFYPKLDISGKHVVLTGAAGGLGTIFAKMLGEMGCKVSLVDVNNERLNKLKQKLLQLGYRVNSYELDVSDQNSVRQMVERSEKAFGPIQVLINNAGRIVFPSKISKTNPLAFLKVIQTNFLSTVYFNRVLLDKMIERRSGYILNVSSFAGKVGMPGLSAYTASKFAINGLSESLRQELSIHKVQVTLAVPYFIFAGFVEPDLSVPWYKPVMNPEWACRRMLDALLQGESEVVLPWKLNILLFLKSVLPFSIGDRLSALLPLQKFKVT